MQRPWRLFVEVTSIESEFLGLTYVRSAPLSSTRTKNNGSVSTGTNIICEVVKMLYGDARLPDLFYCDEYSPERYASEFRIPSRSSDSDELFKRSYNGYPGIIEEKVS